MITITRVALDMIAAAARRAVPGECCGLLLGSGDTIAEAAATRNIALSPNRFTIHPADHIAILRETRQRDIEVVGFYHSHPHSAPIPSETDRSEASYPGYLYLIMGVTKGAAEARIFRLERGDFVEAPFVVAAGT